MSTISEEEKISRIGEVNYNHKGDRMTIIDYQKYTDVTVQFDNGYIKHVAYNHFKNGSVKNKMSPLKFKGIIGDVDLEKNREIVSAWRAILRRSFSEKQKEIYPTYKDVTCCDEWLYLSNFIEWVKNQSNWEVIQNYKWQVDKDILYRGNKIYSPTTCLLVTNNVNSLFVKKDKNRGQYPIGVIKPNIHYSSCCRNPYGKPISHHGFITPEEAFQQYKIDKENIIKLVADKEYALGKITKECYDAMYSYEVNIND